MANVNRYDPFGELVDDFLKGFFVKPVAYESGEAVRRLRIDVVEQNGEYKVLAELPGVRKEDINVQVDGDQVSIIAEAKVDREAKEGERILHTERYAGKLARSFRLGEEIDEARVAAKYNDGVLELRLPKKAPVAAKQITIQ
jgi:HSP20 family protein